MGSKEVEMGPLLVAAPQLRRSPRRHGSDSDLDTTAGTTGNDTTALDDTVDAELSASTSSFSPFKPKLMRCTSTPANLMAVAMRPGRSRMPLPPVMPRFVPHHKDSEMSSIASSVNSTSSAADSCCTDTSDSGMGSMGSTDISAVSPVHARSGLGAIPRTTTTGQAMLTRSRKSSSSASDEFFFSPPDQPALKRRGGGRGRQAPRDISRRWGVTDTTTPDQEHQTTNHRFTVDSPGLFINRDHLDFVRRLADKNMTHILDKIWSLLPSGDLSSAMQVSTLWNSSVKATPAAMSRWREAKAMWSPENAKADLASGKRGRSQRKARLLKQSPRKALGNVSNLLAEESLVFEASSSDASFQSTRLRQRHAAALVNPLPPPVLGSPSKFRHRLFADEASRLKPEEQLRPCPRCTLPSRVNMSDNRAHCTRISCQFDFCTKCMCEYHGDTRCRTSVKVASSSTTKSVRGRKNLNFSSDVSALETSDLINVTGKSPDTKNAAPAGPPPPPAPANVSLNSTRTGRRKMSATVASEKSKSRLKRL